MSAGRAGRRLLGTAVLAVALGGCSVSVNGGGRTVDTDEVEQQLVEAQRQASPGLDVGEAVCPSEVAATVGTTFECVVTVEGVEAPYTANLTSIDEDAKRGNFDLQPAKAILSTDKLVEFLAGQLGPGGRNARIDCGAARVKVVDEGATFDCTVAESRGSQTVTLRADNLEGTVTIVGTR